MDMTHWKSPDAGKAWSQEEKGKTEDEVVGWHHHRWTWVWVNSGSWWWTGRPGVLQSMGSQRVRHNRMMELNWTSLIHYSFLDPGKTTTSEKYAQQFDEMLWKLQCPQLALVHRKGLILLHDNSWPHVIQPMLQKLNKLSYEVLPHLLYSPDISPTNFHFFKHLDNFLQGICFHNQQDWENAFQEFIKSQSTDFCALGINKLISRWQQCIDCNGSYFYE